MVSEESATGLPFDSRFRVDVDLTSYPSKQAQLFYTWIVLWCRRHCKSEWTVRLVEDRKDTHLLVRFLDGREAIYFKMSPEYDSRLKTHFLHWIAAPLAA